MPKSYLVALSRGSSLDETTNNWSLFNLIEQLSLGGTTPEKVREERPVLPLELHAHWEFSEDELGLPFEFRIQSELDGHEVAFTRAYQLLSEAPRHRVRVTGVQLPGVGRVTIRLYWRAEGEEEWHPDHAAWPLEVSAEADVPPELPLDPGT